MAIRQRSLPGRYGHNDVTDADWYLLDRKTDDASEQIMIRFMPLSPTEYLDTQVDGLTTYVYNIFAGLAEFIGNS
jgi:hypothetical protein